MFGTAVGGAGSSRGRIGNTIDGTGFDGSFVPCAQAGSAKAGTQSKVIHSRPDTRIANILNRMQRGPCRTGSSAGRDITASPSSELLKHASLMQSLYLSSLRSAQPAKIHVMILFEGPRGP